MSEHFKPDGEVVKHLIARLFTRNNPDRVTRNADRLQFLKNVSNLAENPALHLGFCTKLIDQYAENGKHPTFEIGLMMGAAIALCSCSRANEKIIKQMLKDIETQQENIDGQEKSGADSKSSEPIRGQDESGTNNRIGV